MPNKQLQTPLLQSSQLEMAASSNKVTVPRQVILTQMYHCGRNAVIESPLQSFDHERILHPMSLYQESQQEMCVCYQCSSAQSEHGISNWQPAPDFDCRKVEVH